MKTMQLALLTIFGLMMWSRHERSASAALQIPHPDDASKRVEYFVEAPAGKGPWPIINLLHGLVFPRFHGRRIDYLTNAGAF